jgi:hypothetical protein
VRDGLVFGGAADEPVDDFFGGRQLADGALHAWGACSGKQDRSQD